MEENIESGIDNPAFENIQMGIKERKITKSLEKMPKSETLENDIDSDSEFEDLPEPEFNKVQKLINDVHQKISNCSKSLKRQEKMGHLIKIAKYVSIWVCFTAYFIWALVTFLNSDQENFEWCDGFGFLLIIFLIGSDQLHYKAYISR